MTSRRLHLKLTVLAVAGCCLVAGPAAGSASATTCPGANADPVETPRKEIARTTLCLLNQERSSRGLSDLRFNPRLSKAARGHSGDMVAKHYFEHVSKSGHDVVDRLRKSGYLAHVQTWMVGENLAWGSGERGSPRQIMRAWMHSAGHRRNILTSRFREVGIGTVVGTPDSRGPRGATYTTTFGARG